MKTKFLAVATMLSLAFFNYLALSADKPAATGAEAKIERAAAERIALARVPGGHIKEGELEKEHGVLVWSFDIALPASADITEVQVDAVSGAVVSVVTETPADQAKEAAEDKSRSKSH
jgi:hypothetical protein